MNNISNNLIDLGKETKWTSILLIIGYRILIICINKHLLQTISAIITTIPPVNKVKDPL